MEGPVHPTLPVDPGATAKAIFVLEKRAQSFPT